MSRSALYQRFWIGQEPPGWVQVGPVYVCNARYPYRGAWFVWMGP